jgi:hypothetical protein
MPTSQRAAAARKRWDPYFKLQPWISIGKFSNQIKSARDRADSSLSFCYDYQG